MAIIDCCTPLAKEEYSIVAVHEVDGAGRVSCQLKLHYWPSWLRKGGKQIVADILLWLGG